MSVAPQRFGSNVSLCFRSRKAIQGNWPIAASCPPEMRVGKYKGATPHPRGLTTDLGALLFMKQAPALLPKNPDVSRNRRNGHLFMFQSSSSLQICSQNCWHLVQIVNSTVTPQTEITHALSDGSWHLLKNLSLIDSPIRIEL